jgi:hypothetical protein
VSERAFDAAKFYRRSLSLEDRARLPYYGQLIDALADSPVACDLLKEARPEQRNPMLVLAALHYGALCGDEVLDPLYDAIGVVAPEEFASQVVARLEALPELVRDQLHRATQTNEPGRSAVMAAVLRELKTRGVHDVHLIDVGTSMGLNLYPDLYRVNINDHDHDDDDASALSMLDLYGTVGEGALPTIHQRIGIDLNPLDPDELDDVRWLDACLWPEEPERAARLRAALEQMHSWPTATRLKGSALDLIDEVVASCSSAATPVIFHSWVASYFSLNEQRVWRERVMQHVTNGALWIYFEHPLSVAGLRPPPSHIESPRHGGTQIVVSEVASEPASWGWSHPHGRWIALAPPVRQSPSP